MISILSILFVIDPGRPEANTNIWFYEYSRLIQQILMRIRTMVITTSIINLMNTLRDV